MANKNPLRGLPGERKARQLERARRKAESQARDKAERRKAQRPGTMPDSPGPEAKPSSGIG